MSNLSSRARSAIRLIAATAVLTVLASCGGGTQNIVYVPNSLVVADFTGDGKPDIAVALAQVDETGLSEPDGLLDLIRSTSTAGSYYSGVTTDTGPKPPSGIATGDIMGTGAHDIVVASNAGGSVGLLTETSPTSGTFNAVKTITTGGNPNQLTLADINGDGALDIVVADGSGHVLILLQDPNNHGSFGTPISLAVPTRGASVAVADLDGDGLPDIVATSYDASGANGEVQVFYQNAGATSTTVSFQDPVEIASGCTPSQVVTADLTGTGLQSVLVACQGLADGNMGLMVIPQTSARVFGDAVITATSSGYGAISLAVGDLDHDGLPDVVLSSLYPTYYGNVSIMIQDPNNPGTFAALGTYDCLGQPVRVQLADMNGDGYLDIVVADATTAGVLLGDPSVPGTFGSEYQVGY